MLSCFWNRTSAAMTQSKADCSTNAMQLPHPCCSLPCQVLSAENRPGNGREAKDSKSGLRSWSAQWQLWLCGSGLWQGSEDALTASVGAPTREKSLRINHLHRHSSLEATSLEMCLLFAVEQRWTKQQVSREQEGS